MSTIYVSGSFDDLRSPQVRFLEEAARLGPVHVALWSDAAVEQVQGKAPKFVEAERQYLLESIRYVDRVTLCAGPIDRDRLPLEAASSGTWVVGEGEASAAKEAFCRQHGLAYRVLRNEELRGLPEDQYPRSHALRGNALPRRSASQELLHSEHVAKDAGASGNCVPTRSMETRTVPARKKAIVTGCYDWFHSGHVRFFEEVSALGELYVCVGHDANIRFLKGEGHPMFPAEERRYMVQSIRFVHRALISSGDGWLDAEPEIERLRPDIYAVNEDGDRPEKRAYCEAHGIEYRVLKRLPKEGLPRRQSTDLRGF
jgi:cytidyltransferase-like protein